MDRQTDRFAISLSHVSMLTRDKSDIEIDWLTIMLFRPSICLSISLVHLIYHCDYLSRIHISQWQSISVYHSFAVLFTCIHKIWNYLWLVHKQTCYVYTRCANSTRYTSYSCWHNYVGFCAFPENHAFLQLPVHLATIFSISDIIGLFCAFYAFKWRHKHRQLCNYFNDVAVIKIKFVTAFILYLIREFLCMLLDVNIFVNHWMEVNGDEKITEVSLYVYLIW